MSILKTRTLTWKQMGAIKWSSIAFALLVAHYWPVVTTWTTFWWIVFIVLFVYVLSFFKK